MSQSTELRDKFLKKLFVAGNYCEKLFHKLCKDGCSPEDLAVLLFATCTVAVGCSQGLIDFGELSTEEVRRLARDLRSLASRVSHLNKTSQNPKIEILSNISAVPDTDRDALRKYVARHYDMLPGIMNVYAFHLEHFLELRSRLLKRMTHTHFDVLRLLLYVEERTGNPRYEDISNLLTAGFTAAGGSEGAMPRFFTIDALTKLKQRTAKFGLTSRFGAPSTLK